MSPDPNDVNHFRQTLGNYPTGVTVVTAIDQYGSPAGMVIGSFTSVSLDPPLVAYLPAKTSTTFPRIRTAETFCINILASDQEGLSRVVGSKKRDAFADFRWRPAKNGAPIFEGSLAWIECSIHDTIDAGDHYLVIGDVLALNSDRPGSPLVFYQGGFGAFAPFSVFAPGETGLADQLRQAESCRRPIERLAAELHTEVTISAAAGDHMVVLGSSGREDGAQTWVGLRTPFSPPSGAVYYAWSTPAVIESWTSQADKNFNRAGADALKASIARIRDQGWSLSLSTPETQMLEQLHRTAAANGLDSEIESKIRDLLPAAAAGYNPEIVAGRSYAVRVLSVPIFGPGGSVVLTLQTRGDLGKRVTAEHIWERAETMKKYAAEATALVGGIVPDA